MKLTGGGSVCVSSNAFLGCHGDEETGIPTGVRVILFFTEGLSPFGAILISTLYQLDCQL
jgi:hypothetical protein